jgi:tetratricopeptide (TPR) repeat protein
MPGTGLFETAYAGDFKIGISLRRTSERTTQSCRYFTDFHGPFFIIGRSRSSTAYTGRFTQTRDGGSELYSLKMATAEEIESVLRNGTSARRAGRLSEALQLMNEAAGMCGPGQDISLAYVLRELGELARNRHDLNTAQAHYERAVNLLRISGDRLKLAHTIRHLGDVHARQQHRAEAERCYAEALDIYRGHPSPAALDLANAIRAYAVFKTETGQLEGSRSLWAEASELYECAGLPAAVEECRRRANELPGGSSSSPFLDS